MRISRVQSFVGAIAATLLLAAEANPLPQSLAEPVLSKRVLPSRYKKRYCLVYSGWDASNSENTYTTFGPANNPAIPLATSMEALGDGSCASLCTQKRDPSKPPTTQCNYVNTFQYGSGNYYKCALYSADPMQAPGVFANRNAGFNGAGNVGNNPGTDKKLSSGRIWIPPVPADDPRHKSGWLYQCLGSAVYDDETMKNDAGNGKRIFIESMDFPQSAPGVDQVNADFCITRCENYNHAKTAGGVVFPYCNVVLFYNKYDQIGPYASSNPLSGNWPSTFHCSLYTASPEVWPNPAYSPTVPDPTLTFGSDHPQSWIADSIMYKRISQDDVNNDPSLSSEPVRWRGGRRGALYSPVPGSDPYPYENSNQATII
ncbi:hypothetical protein TWF696_009462 [Orbilia brochopaga]|uniref:Uncharacterized protein n=1 Tax=Orbilia brochopaga TaxID=3140254 RepID=A0AAV9UDQ7_9PEZI